jgi:hypothetical protein
MRHKLEGVWLVITPLIHNLSAGWRRIVNFGPQPFYLTDCNTHILRGYVGPGVDQPAHRLVSIAIMLSRFCCFADHASQYNLSN